MIRTYGINLRDYLLEIKYNPSDKFQVLHFISIQLEGIHNKYFIRGMDMHLLVILDYVNHSVNLIQKMMHMEFFLIWHLKFYVINHIQKLLIYTV
jgi:hypothetical protein